MRNTFALLVGLVLFSAAASSFAAGGKGDVQAVLGEPAKVFFFHRAEPEVVSGTVIKGYEGEKFSPTPKGAVGVRLAATPKWLKSTDDLGRHLFPARGFVGVSHRGQVYLARFMRIEGEAYYDAHLSLVRSIGTPADVMATLKRVAPNQTEGDYLGMPVSKAIASASRLEAVGDRLRRQGECGVIVGPKVNADYLTTLYVLNPRLPGGAAKLADWPYTVNVGGRKIYRFRAGSGYGKLHDVNVAPYVRIQEEIFQAVPGTISEISPNAVPKELVGGASSKSGETGLVLQLSQNAGGWLLTTKLSKKPPYNPEDGEYVTVKGKRGGSFSGTVYAVTEFTDPGTGRNSWQVTLQAVTKPPFRPRSEIVFEQ